MGLNIRQLNKSLEIKIKKCIALLGEEYMSLNFTIYFYETREKLQKERDNKPDLKREHYEQILNGEIETAGLTILEEGKIKIFLFLFQDLKENPTEVIDLIGNLYHEIRHAWQFENNLYQDEKEIDTIDGDLESYLSLPYEKDAYRFQDENMKKHGEEILRIFGFQLKISYRLADEIRNIIYS
ncbi:hypothetical protein NMG90_21465 [Bacillus mycoides]|uniref:hypothetical protein n=1 Tax=Bacillus mycoides TaxID=1405 RepID=UPI0020CA05F3|nr:hypothetical protein [Bacillus mycoides]MCP9227918.1 hypothetical protein [Bacillus mycoides]